MQITSEQIFNDETYLNFDTIRFNHFDTLRIDFKDKTILELGSGIGNHTEFILSKNPKMIVSVEGRKENFEVLMKRFEAVKEVIPVHFDLENKLPQLEKHYDWIYNYGLLYHLKNPFHFIDNLSKINHDNMILETCIELDGDENIIKESSHQSQALSGIGSRPNIYILIEKLKKIYNKVIYPKQPNHPWFDIHRPNNNSPLKRIVIICKEKR